MKLIISIISEQRMISLTFCLLLMGGVPLYAQEEKSSKRSSSSIDWFMDSQGKINPNSKYSFYSFTPDSNVIQIIYGQKYGLVDRMGNEITPIKYDEIRPFSYGAAIVSQAYQYGLINTLGKELTPLKYSEIVPVAEGLFIVQRDYKFGVVDYMGKELTPLKFDDLIYISENLIAFNIGGKWGQEEIFLLRMIF